MDFTGKVALITGGGGGIGRYAPPKEVAGAVLYLCSDLSGGVTGTHIGIDGGRSGSGGVAPVKRI